MDVDQLRKLKIKRFKWFLAFVLFWALGSFSLLKFFEYNDKIGRLDQIVLE